MNHKIAKYCQLISRNAISNEKDFKNIADYKKSLKNQLKKAENETDRPLLVAKYVKRDGDIKNLQRKIKNIQRYEVKFKKLSNDLKLNYEIPISKDQAQKIIIDLGEKQSFVSNYNKFTSLLYSYESFANDYKWDCLWFVARGKRSGEFEGISILEYLYRYERAGEKIKRSVFPGISYYNDAKGNNSKFSFLWRVLNIESKDDKTSGHIFFIPFGRK